MNYCICCNKEISKKAKMCIPCNNKQKRDYTKIVEKRIKTMITKYGINNAMMCDEFKKKLEKTNIEKYGVSNVFQSDLIKDKIKQTNIEKYGVEYPSQSKDIRLKIVESLIKSYGVDSPLKSKEIFDNMKSNNFEKYGYEYVSQVKVFIEKMLETRKDKRTYNIDEFIEYRELVNKLTTKNKKYIIENWDGFDFYDGEYIKDNFNINSNNKLYPTIDHKMSILYCFKNKLSAEQSSSIDNLCITKRGLNSMKNVKTEEEFRNFLQ